MQEGEELPSSQRRRSQLPPLAPRRSQSSSRDRPSGSASGRTPRLSHRSRAGCWTCRARKVKCDEVHPKCGPCTRLNRECDWDHRWNFSDATTSTQIKYSNVKTTGNAVWDPDVRPRSGANPASRHHDDLPAFNALATDEERERKAETQRPGTFGVVVTPESFIDLPEYATTTSSSPASRRMSVQSLASSITNPTPPPNHLLTRIRTDPNIVVLHRFEDTSPTAATPFSISPPRRSSSIPDSLRYLALTSPPSRESAFSSYPPSPIIKSEHNLTSHFRHYIVQRLIQPLIEETLSDIISPGSTRDAFEVESANFQPLHHAICALSALNIAYNGTSSLEQAMQHYHQALSAQTTASNPEELLSSGAFLRHFLLFIYDICIPMRDGSYDTDMWTIHLSHLQRIAILRNERFGYEPHAFLIWCIAELDMYACLLGSGNCDFLQTMLQHNMLPLLDQQLPHDATSLSGQYLTNETSIFPDILALNQAVVIQTAKLAQVAQTFRSEAMESSTVAPGTAARWQARVSQLQSELNAMWAQTYPAWLNSEDPRTAAEELPSRVRFVFEHAYVLYQSAIIYSRTSMFPGQSRIPVANQNGILADTESRILSIISVATNQLKYGQLNRRHIVFPLFIAGFAATQPDVKIQALDLMKSYEGSGIGRNTYRTRQLLTVVYEEQRRMANEGGRMEDVDWLAIAKERSLMVINCGL